nr:phage major capsid protein [uncultured Cellulosilyticum sp.]
MSKQLREMLNSIATKKATAKALVAENKVEEAKTAMAELKELQAKAEMLAELEEDDDDEIEDKVNNKKVKELKDKTKMSVANAFVQCVKAMAKRQAAPVEAMEVLDSVTHMTEGVDEDGGLTVPQDIQTKVKELRRGQDALEELVNIESVSTLSGSRVIEKNADETPWDNVDEEADFPEVQGPQFEKIAYKVKKKGGVLKLTKELLSDTAENIMTYLYRWIAKKSKVTRNFIILKAVADNFGSAKTIDGLDALKKVFNIELDPALALDAKVVTNQDGFNWLDTLKDTDGKYVLQPNPTDATKKLLFGRYEVIVLSNKTLKTASDKAPIYCGNFKEALTLFDREYMTIETSDQAGDMWSKDQVGVKVRERLDIQVVDSEAIVKGEITITP